MDEKGALIVSFKKVSAVVYTLIIIFAIGFLYSINTSSSVFVNTSSSSVGPAYFPNFLGMLLIVLSLLSLVKSLRNSSQNKLTIPQFKMILFTFIITLLFVLAWSYLGWFYLQCFLFLTVLFTVYRMASGHLFKNTITGALLAMVITALIYVLFDLFMHISF